MASYFFDTSALAKRYIQETGSSWVGAICDDTKNNLVFVSDLTEIELVAAITRRAKGGTLTATSAQTEIKNFDSDLGDQYLAVAISRQVLLSARAIVERYSLRGYDAVQLASALACSQEQTLLGLPPIFFVSADVELLAAAKTHGLQIENPDDHK